MLFALGQPYSLCHSVGYTDLDMLSSFKEGVSFSLLEASAHNSDPITRNSPTKVSTTKKRVLPSKRRVRDCQELQITGPVWHLSCAQCPDVFRMECFVRKRVLGTEYPYEGTLSWVPVAHTTS
jgi:hypothetical protein